MTYLIQTARLRLREFTLNDTRFILELLNSPGWLQFIGDRNVRTEEQARHYLTNGPMKSYAENGYGLSLVEKSDDGQAIGMCGIIRRDSLDNPDIGFAFLPDFHSNGYAYEIVSATMRFASDQLGLPRVCAITVAGNSKSIRVLEKIGLRFTKTFYLEGNEEELCLYSS